MNRILPLATIMVAAVASRTYAGPFEVKPGFKNPSRLGAGSVKSEIRGDKLGFPGDCADVHFQKAPIATLDVKAAMKKLEVTVSGPDAIAVKIGDGVVCKVTAYAREDPTMSSGSTRCAPACGEPRRWRWSRT